jgi:hypothetical protein
MTTAAREPDIPGTTLFDGAMARKGYALNKVCYSFNQAANRDAFVRDEAGYCVQYGLTDEQLAAVRVLIIGTGGLSHQLDGERAGFINKAFDLMCMDTIVDDPERLTRLSIHDLVREVGAQGTELMTWIAARGALTGKVTKVHSNYHIPISNTAGALMVLENHSQSAARVRAA